MRWVSNHSQPNDSKSRIFSIFIPFYSSFWDSINPKYWPNLAICCVLCFYTLSTQLLQLLKLFGVMLPKSVFGIEAIPNTDLIWRYAVCVVFLYTLNSMTPNIVFEKYYMMTSTELGNKCFKTCSWIPLTMVKSLLLNSALLEIKILAPAFNCSYASSVLNKSRTPLTVCGIRLHLQAPLTFCGIHLQLRNPK